MPAEMACIGSVQEKTLSYEIYVASVEGEGVSTFAVEGQIVHLNGPRVSTLKPGMLQRVVRPEGRVDDPQTGNVVGVYYKDIGTIRIENVASDHATARVQMSCQEMLKGDLIMPHIPKQRVEFGGNLSDDLTVLPENGLVGSILFEQNDMKELGSGHFCYMSLGQQSGIRPGDRLTVFRTYPAFNPRDLDSGRPGSQSTYSSMDSWKHRATLNSILSGRKLPPQILGDIVVVETGDKTSTGRIVSSLAEIHVGDLVIKR